MVREYIVENASIAVGAERRILKFIVEYGFGEIETADEPRFLATAWQGNNVVVWVEATPGRGVTTGVAGIFTGEPVPVYNKVEYVGTAVSEIVVHVYRQRKEAA